MSSKNLVIFRKKFNKSEYLFLIPRNDKFPNEEKIFKECLL